MAALRRDLSATRAEQQPLLPDRPGQLARSISFCGQPLLSDCERMPTKDQITEALRAVIDPELRRSIVDLGMVRSIEIPDDGGVDVVVSLTTPGCPIRSHFQQAVSRTVGELDGVTRRRRRLRRPLRRGEGRAPAGRSAGPALPEGALAQVKNVICVASGKGGVGKSTMTANLAAALAADGHSAGALDARRLRLLDPAHARDRRAAGGERRAQDHPARRARRREGDVDRLLRRGRTPPSSGAARCSTRRSSSSSRTSPGASSTTCCSTFRRAPATSR